MGNSEAKRAHEKDMLEKKNASKKEELDAKTEQVRLQKEIQEGKHQAEKERVEKEIAEAKRKEKVAEAAAKARAKEKAEEQERNNAAEKEKLRMKNEAAEKAIQHQERENKRREELEIKKKEMDAKRQREEEAHREQMREMIISAKQNEVKDKRQQRDNAVKQMTAAVEKVEDQIKQDTLELKELEQQYIGGEDKLRALDMKILSFFKQKSKKKDSLYNADGGDEKDNDNDYDKTEEEHSDDEDYIDPAYVKCKREMLNALKIFERDDKEIWSAIEKTGQREDGVGRFLKLTHGLIGETMASQDNANKLDAELHTFSTMIKRECQDKLSIKYLFNDRKLDRFVPILAKQNYTDCQELICQNEDEFKEQILDYVENEVDKQIADWKKKHPNEEDPFETFLDHYKLTKYKRALKDLDIDSLEAVNDEDLDDETIAEIITEAKITGLGKKKFKRAIKDAQSGKYQPPETEANADDDDKENTSDKEQEERPLEVNPKEARLLKTICLTDPESWKALEREKQKQTKLALIETSPVFGGFFSRMFDVVQQAQSLLSYSPNLNAEQNKAMSALMGDAEPKAIEAPKSIEDDDKAPDEDEDEDNDNEQEMKEDDPEKLPDYPQRKGWKEAAAVQVYSKTDGRWYDGKIVDIATDKEGEWLNIEYVTPQHKKQKQVDRYGKDVRDPVMVECRAITAAIDVDINVTQLMMNEFALSKTTERILPVARGVETSTKAILLCQSQIRQSVRLAGSILKLKPANLTDAAKPLWKAVDDGIIHIVESALEMSKISVQYFGFFLRFNQSFKRFVSMYEQDKEVTLFTSLEHVISDISDFSAFKKQFNTKVQKLSDESMQVIQNCVATHIGVEQFESTRNARERAEKDYLDKKSKYDKQKSRLDLELEKLRDKRANDLGEQAGLKTRIQQLKQKTEDNKAFKREWLEEIKTKLNKVFDSSGAFNDPNKL